MEATNSVVMEAATVAARDEAMRRSAAALTDIARVGFCREPSCPGFAKVFFPLALTYPRAAHAREAILRGRVSDLARQGEAWEKGLVCSVEALCHRNGESGADSAHRPTSSPV